MSCSHRRTFDKRIVGSIGKKIAVQIGNSTDSRIDSKIDSKTGRWSVNLSAMTTTVKTVEVIGKVYSSRLHLTDSESIPGLGR